MTVQDDRDGRGWTAGLFASASPLPENDVPLRWRPMNALPPPARLGGKQWEALIFFGTRVTPTGAWSPRVLVSSSVNASCNAQPKAEPLALAMAAETRA
mmetsp:Transcript_24047/g.55629  ORF Transcript_24047/g.55629 Transcript_24047/m.55629 type:complete len:99 (-) Transcript_24047:1101-1397(-)